MTGEQIFLSAIRDRDGTVNVGYLFLFKVMRTFWVELAVMTIGATIAMYAAWDDTDEMVKVLSAYGTAVGIVASANFLTALTGIAAFLWGDRTPAGTATTTTTTTATAPVPAAPVAAPVVPAAPVPAAALIAAAGGVEPLHPKIGEDDVGKSVALVSRKKPQRRKRGRKA